MRPVLDPRTPVLVGVAETTDRIDAPDYAALSAHALAARAAREALIDAGARCDLSSRIDVIATTRTFEDSAPGRPSFGKSDNFPRSVARQAGIDPQHAIWTYVGGNTPQDLVSEMCERIANGEYSAALLAGSEVISTVRHAKASGRNLDFADSPGGSVEDRGLGLERIFDPISTRHGVVTAPIGYALLENARRARLGLNRAAYAREMGRLFAPFVGVAQKNPKSAWEVPAYSADELVLPGTHNRWIVDPYPLRLVSRDQVNQAAAVVIVSVATARELGVPEDRWVYLHGYAKASERSILDRPDLGASPAAQAAAKAAIDRADTTVDAVDLFDFYSCFPIAVSTVACDALGLDADDPRRLTVAGGLPFFGGPGNNYSMHAIVEMVGQLRARPTAKGFVGANGGFLSKYSAAVYSARPRAWQACNSQDLQNALDAKSKPVVVDRYEGPGEVETFTITYDRNGPQLAIVIGRAPEGHRFMANSHRSDKSVLNAFQQVDPIGMAIAVAHDEEAGINLFRLVNAP